MILQHLFSGPSALRAMEILARWLAKNGE